MRKLLWITLSCFLTACGLLLLKHSHAVTGGTAGLALNLSYLLRAPFFALFFAINLPFYVFSFLRMGTRFTLYTLFSVTLLSLFTGLDVFLPAFAMPILPGAVVGGALAGLGLTLLFLNGSSLGGSTILALFLQKRFKLDPGKVNFTFDFLVVVTSLGSIGWINGAYSVLSIAITSLIISYFKTRIAEKTAKKTGTPAFVVSPSQAQAS